MKIKYMICAVVLAGILNAMEPSQGSQRESAQVVRSAWKNALSKRVSFDVDDRQQKNKVENDLVLQSVNGTPVNMTPSLSTSKRSQKSISGKTQSDMDSVSKQYVWFQSAELCSKPRTPAPLYSQKYFTPSNSHVKDDKETANAGQEVTFTIPEQLATVGPRRRQTSHESNINSTRNVSIVAVAGDPISPAALTPVPTRLTIIIQPRPCCTIL